MSKLILALAFFPVFSALAAAPDHREQTAELLAREAIQKKNHEAGLASCNFDKLISEGVFTCYSHTLNPAAVCDNGTRSAPFYIVEGYLDVELQPQIDQVLFYEACEGLQR